MKAIGVDQNGKSVEEKPVEFVPDGRLRAIPEFPGLKSVFWRSGLRTIRTEVKREDGSVVGGSTYAVSADGKFMTANAFGYDSQFRPFKQYLVLDRE
jgi:hypothetical protein